MYIFECGGRYKIGVSDNVDRRVKELDNRPFPVRLVAKSRLVHCAFEAEREIHEWLEEYRLSGEWFDIPNTFIGAVIRAVIGVDDTAYGYGEE